MVVVMIGLGVVEVSSGLTKSQYVDGCNQE
jgi:hypothetical protein